MSGSRTTSTAPVRGDGDDPALRRAPALVGLVWGLLIFNTLGTQGSETILPLPRALAQVLTMGALLLAFTLALALNRRLRIQPSAFLLLLSLLLVVAVVSSAEFESGWGSLARSARFAMFVATLWLLSRWWDSGMTFVHYHIRTLGIVLLTVAAGVVVVPGMAMPDLTGGRLVGVVWPLTPAQIAQYAAIVAGLAILLWLGRRTDGRSVLYVVVPAVVLLLLTHTRTATLGLLVGLGVAGLSLLLSSARTRRVFGLSMVTIGLAAAAFAPAVQAWFTRGQDDAALNNLTGRTKVWEALLSEQRTTKEQLLGVGLTDKSFGGLAIDNSWLAVYHEQGIIGVGIVSLFLITLITVAILRPPSTERACAIFLIVYCLVASYTEVGLGDASPYLLHLTVAAILLLPRPATPAHGRPDRQHPAGETATP